MHMSAPSPCLHTYPHMLLPQAFASAPPTATVSTILPCLIPPFRQSADSTFIEIPQGSGNFRGSASFPFRCSTSTDVTFNVEQVAPGRACQNTCLYTCLDTCPDTCLYTRVGRTGWHVYTHVSRHVYTHVYTQEQVAPDGKSDSLQLQLDASAKVVWHVGQSADWSWSRTSPLFKSVSDGAHTLRVLGREDGIKLRAIRFVDGAASCSWIRCTSIRMFIHMPMRICLYTCMYMLLCTHLHSTCL